MSDRLYVLDAERAAEKQRQLAAAGLVARGTKAKAEGEAAKPAKAPRKKKGGEGQGSLGV